MIKKQIILGKLNPGDKLPSTRSLAIAYNVNPNTAARIYKEMEVIGMCYTKRGLGTYVTESEETLDTIKYEMANSIISNFIDQMLEIGYSYEDMIKIIEKRGINS